jgi:hypothetical protein
MCHFRLPFHTSPTQLRARAAGRLVGVSGSHCQGLAEPVFKPLVVRNGLNSNNKED